LKRLEKLEERSSKRNVVNLCGSRFFDNPLGIFLSNASAWYNDGAVAAVLNQLGDLWKPVERGFVVAA